MDYLQLNQNDEGGLQIITQSLFDMIFGSSLLYLFWFLVIVAFLVILRRTIKAIAKKSSFYDHTVFLVKLPKEKPGDTEKEMSVQELREIIARGETIFASIGGLKAQNSFKSWLLGRTDHFSFEIVAKKKQIGFYVVAPTSAKRYIEQQVHAYFGEASIEEVSDYNIFQTNSAVLAGHLKTRRNFLLPIRTYNNMDTDPMNSILNVMTKLKKDEGIAVQYVVRSAKASWHSQAGSIGRKIYKGESINSVLKDYSRMPVMRFLFDLFKSSKPPEETINQNANRLTQMEEEMLKAIEEKNAKAGLDINLRIVVSAENIGQAKIYLENLTNAYSQYNQYEYGNSFLNRINTYKKNKTIQDFIYRRFNPKITFLLNTEELTSLFHFPNKTAETPNIMWLTAKSAPAQTGLGEEGIILGQNIYRGQKKDIYIKRQDRRRHSYLIGKSGTGKSTMIASMAIQDILNGEGVCVLDPHGDLIEDILLRVPPERAEDVILFAPADLERPLGLNLLEFDSRYPEQKTFVINEMINIFDKLYDLKSTGGPIFEQYVRNAMLLIMSDPESGSTLMEVPKVLADAEFRKMKLEKCSDPTVVDFWHKEAEKAGGDAALANVVPYVTSKLTQFISNDTMRPIIAQQKSSFNVRDVMDKQKILLVDLSKGKVGEMNSHLLGMILVGQILMSALSRTDIPEDKRKDFYLYIDEFQNFTTDSINSILSEARKYKLNLIIAHQYLGQLAKNQDTSIRDAVFGNVGTWILFKVGSDDAEIMEKEFSPVFNQFDLINVEKYTAYIKLLVDNTASKPFSIKTIHPLPGIPRPELRKKIKTLSRLKYGQDRKLVEAGIRKRANI